MAKLRGMPTGTVHCRYVGGPWDGRTEELAAVYCRNSMGVELGAWIAEQSDGSAARQSNDCGATYRFVRMVDVQRCAKVLEDEGRRCKNPALEGQALCRDHEKIRLRQAKKPNRKRAAPA